MQHTSMPRSQPSHVSRRHVSQITSVCRNVYDPSEKGTRTQSCRPQVKTPRQASPPEPDRTRCTQMLPGVPLLVGGSERIASACIAVACAASSDASSESSSSHMGIWTP